MHALNLMHKQWNKCEIHDTQDKIIQTFQYY